MPTKTARAPKRHRRTHHRNGRTHAQARVARPGPGHRQPDQPAGASPARIRVELLSIESHLHKFTFSSTEKGDAASPRAIVVHSRFYPTPKEAKAALIEFIKAIQADDFETFDNT